MCFSRKRPLAKSLQARPAIADIASPILCRATLFPGDIILIKPGRDSSPSAARSRAFDQNSESWPASGLARRAR